MICHFSYLAQVIGPHRGMVQRSAYSEVVLPKTRFQFCSNLQAILLLHSVGGMAIVVINKERWLILSSVKEIMRSVVINMSRARDKRKNLNPREELNLKPSFHRSDTLTTELRWTCGKLGHIHIHHTTLAYGPARHKSFVAQLLEHPTAVRKVTGSIPVGDSDFFFAPCLWHVDHITYHDYCCFLLLQNWFAFSNLHKPLFTKHGYIPFPNKNPPLDEMNNAYCKVRIALNKITLSLTTDYTLFTTGLFEVDVCSGFFNLLGFFFFFAYSRQTDAN